MTNPQNIASTTPLVHLTDCVKVYRTGQVHLKALKGVDLTVHRGEMTAIMGPSGSGKSTLMHIVGLLDEMDEGQYILNGREVQSLTDNEQARARNAEIGFVFQSFNLLQSANLRDNVALPLIYAGVPAAERRKRAESMLERVGLLPWAEHRPGEISGGQKQRVAIARAMINRPSLLLADEPTGNLDSKSGREIMELFVELNEMGTTVILITHDQDIAAYTRRILTIVDGFVVSDSDGVDAVIGDGLNAEATVLEKVHCV
ncbi:MAG TPA: ABC transporter ATP-binding protein [Bacillota bacterium]|jgi:putative ABC transport system ATP-binding protein|nr:ABC transporter ATP-binding protein [Bacillota bacterium]HQC48566.1 ABC transporter ATP-binding protein [Bacillota bacterium]